MSLLRSVIDNANTLLCRLKRGQRVVPIAHAGSVKINLGCGLAVSEGWINVDASFNALVASLPHFVHVLAYRFSGASRYYALVEYCRLLEAHRFVHHDLAHNLPFPDACADFVYSSHFLEHLFPKDARHLLGESFRILKPGGTVRICVPDLEVAVSLYSTGRKREMLDNYFFVEDLDSYFARHKYMYDFEMLKAELEAAGFRDVTRCGYRAGRTPDLAVLDNRPDETLFVEALK